jgi:hypothetical protein
MIVVVERAAVRADDEDAEGVAEPVVDGAGAEFDPPLGKIALDVAVGQGDVWATSRTSLIQNMDRAPACQSIPVKSVISLVGNFAYLESRT